MYDSISQVRQMCFGLLGRRAKYKDHTAFLGPNRASVSNLAPGCMFPRSGGCDPALAGMY